MTDPAAPRPHIAREVFEPGARIFMEGDKGDRAYLIERGRVEVCKGVAGGEQVVIAMLGRGDILGEMALIDDQPRGATARVIEETSAIIVTRDEMNRRLANSDPVVRRMLKIFSERLREVTRRSADSRPPIR